MGGFVFEADNESIRNNSEKGYLDSKTADVKFLFKDSDERVAAHKIILSFGSSVFEAMFYGSLPEKGDILIADASPEAFKEFLQFFYLGKVCLTSDHIFQVANLCNKYKMTEALKCCETPMQRSLTRNNICTGYALALLLEMENVIKFCEQIIKQKASYILKSADFLECNQNLFDKVLQLVSSQCSAPLIVYACMDWAKAKCKQKKVRISPAALKEQLKDSLYRIPFAKLNMKQFDEFTAAYNGFFNEEDFKAIIRKLMSPSNILQCDRRDMDKADVFIRLKMPCTSAFISNTSLLLTEFFIAKASIPEQCDVEAAIFGAEKKPTEKITIIPNETTHVILSEPFSIDANTQYYIVLTTSQEFSRMAFRTKPLADQVKLGGDIEINFQIGKSPITGLVFQKPIG